MRCYAGFWVHDHKDEPVWMAYEVNDSHAVVRMIEVFKEGRSEFRSAVVEGVVNLIDTEFLIEEMDDISLSMPLFEIGAKAFETLWNLREP